MFKTRFAPSPTGLLHLGGLQACLLPYLMALKNNGNFFLRFDDTDDRATNLFKEKIKEDLNWLGVVYDKVISQSNRIDLYESFMKNDRIYACYDSDEYIENVKQMKRLRKIAPIFTREDCKEKNGIPHWRFQLNDNCSFYDELFGQYNSKKVWSDPVIKRSDGTFTYNFVSVIDDIQENVTHIIRGQEHIANTAMQIQMAKILGASFTYYHFPLLLDEDGGKLSKRNNSRSLESLRVYEKWTFYSIITSIGQKQIYSTNLNDYIKHFDIYKMGKSQKKINMDWVEQTNAKIMCHTQSKEKYWNILKNNIKNQQEYFYIMEKLNNFKKTDKWNKTQYTKDEYMEMYNELLNRNYGPPINDLKIILKDMEKL